MSGRNEQWVVCEVRVMVICIVVAAAMGLVASQAFAQSAPEDALQEIVVVAQKRSENIQDTPLSVTAFSADALRNAGVYQERDLQDVDPSVITGAQTGVQMTFIRGLGNPVVTQGNEQSVPIYIDDVYYLTPSPAYLDLANIDHIEVLKGPQGTLFGRNASAGVVSIYTRDPGQTPVFEATLGYASFIAPYAQLYAATPITNTLATDISFSGHDQVGGWGHNLYTGDATYRDSSMSLRSKTVWKPTDETTAKLILYYVDERSEQNVLHGFFRGTYGGGLDSTGTTLIPLQNQSGFYNSNTADDPHSANHSFGGSIRIDQAIGFADLVSISAARQNIGTLYISGTDSPSDASFYTLNTKDQQFSQEFQVKSLPDSQFSWIAGLYYLNALEGFDPGVINGSGYTLQEIDQVAIIGEQRLNSYAEFGQITYPIISNTNLTVGLRYTVDELRGIGITTVYPVPGSVFEGEVGSSLVSQNEDPHKTFDKLTWKYALDHHFTSDLMGYFSYSRGYKSGTFNTLPLGDEPLKPEVVDTYEIGAKSEFFEHRVRLNGAIFRNNLKDPQVQSSLNGLEFLINAPAARSQGVEFEADASIAHGLTARLAGTYLDAKYVDFPNAPLFFQLRGGGAGLSSVDASSNTLPRASKYRAVAGLNHQLSITSLGSFATDFNVAYSSPYPFDADNVAWQKALALINASVTFQPEANSHLQVRVWGKNLSNVRYYSQEYEQTGASGFSTIAAAPRTLGVEARVSF
jgi:iron complex outermembrane recepter protein